MLKKQSRHFEIFVNGYMSIFVTERMPCSTCWTACRGTSMPGRWWN